MSNVTLFTNPQMQMSIPEHLRGIQVDEQTKALAGGTGGLRISIKGGVFRMLNNGQEVARNDDRAMNVVIVRSATENQRTFYANGYVEGVVEAPDCYSTNGVKPEADSKAPQAPACANCPQNIAGSGQNGSRACRYSRNIAVVLEGDIGGSVYKLNLPAQSVFGEVENGVMPLQAYGKQLLAHNLPVSSVVTEMRFDTNSATPKLGFKAVRYLDKAEYEISKRQGDTPEAINATKTTSFQQDGGVETNGAAAPQSAPALQQAAPVAAPAQAAPVVVEHPATVLAPEPAAQPAAPAPKRQRQRAQPTAAAPAAATANTAAQPTPTSTVQTPAPQPAASTAPTPATPGMLTPEQIQAQMAQMAAMLAAMQAGGGAAANLTPAATAGAEPQVLQQQQPAAPIPASTAAMLSNWELEEE